MYYWVYPGVLLTMTERWQPDHLKRYRKSQHILKLASAPLKDRQGQKLIIKAKKGL